MTARLTRPVAIYARVSTDDKGQDVELQLNPLRCYAAQMDWEVREYQDQASANDLRGRKAWRRLLDDTAHRRVGLVLVWKVDRAFRSVLDALATLRDLDARGVGFASLTQPELDTTTPTGKMVFTMLAAFAELEQSLIADRVREGMRNAARKGSVLGRPSAATRPEVARLLPGVRAEVADGTLTHRAAAARLGIGTATLRRLLAA